MKNEAILYSVTPFDPAGHRLRVSLHIPAPAAGGQELFMPAWIPGSYLIRDFARQVETIEASCAGRPLEIRKTGNHTWMTEACTGPLRVEYVVYAWDLSVRSAHVDETHAFFNGTSVYLGVSGQTTQACHVLLCPPPHTDQWKVYTSLSPAQGHAQAAARHGFGRYAAPDYDALIDHPVEMGTPQFVEFTAHGALHEMVFTGVAPNLDLERIAADTKKICEAQIALFEPETGAVPFLDSADRYVFMTMVTGDGYGGLEHRASTALVTSRHHLPVRGRDPDKGYQDFLGLVSHEYFHTWNVKRIKPAAFAPYALTQENFTRLLWVFEGFTSYYDDLMLLRSGVISEADYLARLGKVITAVQRGPGRLKQSVAESSFDAWTRFYKQDENSPNALVSYYTKGALVAMGLDITIRQASNDTRSLDDVMRLLWARYGRDFYKQPAQAEGVAEDAMPALIHEATGVDVRDFIERHAYGREDVPLDALLQTRGIALKTQAASSTPTLDVRLKAGPEGLSLATVYEDGAAHRGGLSAGDVIVAVNGLRANTEAALERLLLSWQPGDTVTMHVFRRDELRCFELVLNAPAADQYVLEKPAQ